MKIAPLRAVPQRESLLAIVLVALFAAVGLQQSTFVTWQNIVNVLYDTSTVAIIAVGVGIVIVAGGIDISVGSTLAATATISGLLAQNGASWWIALLAGVGSGFGLGGINALLITVFAIPPIVATLATLGIFRGVLTQVTQTHLVGNLPVAFTNIGQERVGSIPIPVLVMVGVVLLGALAMRHTGFGRAIYAVGSNARAARLAGLRVGAYQAATYVLSGGLAGLAGVIFAARNGTVLPTSGAGLELLAIAAVVVGGVDIFGGRGSVVGIALGAIFLQSISAGMVVLGIGIAWQGAIVGLTILGAVAAFVVAERAREAHARG